LANTRFTYGSFRNKRDESNSQCSGDFSVLDGWWMEGCIEGGTGWSIDHIHELFTEEEIELRDLYSKLCI
jgi:hypothetical protein